MPPSSDAGGERTPLRRTPPGPVARVLLHAPLPQLDRLLDYAVPPELVDDAQPGVRVRVPLRGAGRLVEGYIVELGVAEDPDRPLSDLHAVLSAVPVLPRRLYELARRVADRAAGSASDIIRLVVPRRQVRVEKAWLAARAEAGPAAAGAIVDAEVVDAARATLRGFRGLDDALEAGGRIALDAPARPAVAPDGSTIGEWATVLAAAAVSIVARGRSAIVVAPDHRDLDQLERALEGAGDLVVRDDAKQSGPDRSRAYLRTLGEAPCIVIGNRSAVYAPVVELGLMAIWDDGDTLLDEPLAPYVHARDAALVRQGIDGGALVFAGHTRTTDVERLVGIGFVDDAPATRRYTPRVVLSANDDAAPGATRMTSAAFRAAREALVQGPVLVQVARPGYAPVLTCAECRKPARCTACGGPLHAARRGAVPQCRWCGRDARGWSCLHCAATSLRLSSSGSVRTADELGRAFPGVRIIVADGDHTVLHVDARPALVIATRGAEPIAEGGYRAVILLDGERMLLAESLRIAESCLRWWSNATALAAPGAPVHLVGVTGAVARALATWTQPSYARTELAERAPLHLPPVARIALLEGTAAAIERAIVDLRTAVPAVEDDDLMGPAERPGPPGSAADDVTYRALLRFDYAHGAAVAASLRASVIQAALRTRRPAKNAGRSVPRNTLRVRVDAPEPEL